MIFITVGLCHAQVDSSYIKEFDHKLALSAFIGKSYVLLNQELASGEEKDFIPNNPPSIGLGISIKNTIINISGGYGFSFLRDKKKGKTKSFDFQFHQYGQKMVYDVFIQSYKGFHSADDDDKHITLYPDLKIQRYGVTGQYVFNNKKFSYAAAFNQNKLQLKSAGSFLAGANIYYTAIKSDSSFIFRDRHSFYSFHVGVNGGYTYTWAINKNWFINGSLSIGADLGKEKNKYNLYFNTFPRIAIGYNSNKWSLGLSYINNMVTPSSKNETMHLSSGNFQLTFTRRLTLIPWDMERKINRRLYH